MSIPRPNRTPSVRDRVAKLSIKHTLDAIQRKHATIGKGPLPGANPQRTPLGRESAHPGVPRVRQETLPICIVGAGAAGLYAAMILQDLGFKYEILEAEKPEAEGGRLGGRIYTHRFNGNTGLNAPVGTPARYDYIDMGAMRYPNISSHAPVYDLFHRLWPTPEEYNKMVKPYIMTSPNQIDYYNNIRTLSSDINNIEDVFQVKAPSDADPTAGGFVPQSYLRVDGQNVNDGGYWTDKALSEYTGPLGQATDEKEFAEAWNKVIQHDSLSTRAYMTRPNPNPAAGADVDYPEYPDAVVEWLEMLNTGTGLYNEAFTESVMDAMDFDDTSAKTGAGRRETSTKAAGADWSCLDGGSDHLIRAMIAWLVEKDQDNDHHIKFGKRVIEINPSGDNMVVNVDGGPRAVYSQVICTVPLGCLASINMNECNLTFTQKVAMRSLAYDASTKVAIKFASRWWEEGEQPIHGGVTYTDLPIRVVVYPSYGLNLPADQRAPGVLLASYTWAQDARRMGSISEPKGERELLNLVMSNLQEMFPTKQLYNIAHKVVAWYNEPNARGAFALFGPGQFGPTDKGAFSLYASLKAPAAGGRLHFAGEATSVHHAWVVGALNSAYRAVHNALWGDLDALKTLKENWPLPDEEDLYDLSMLAAYGSLGQV